MSPGLRRFLWIAQIPLWVLVLDLYAAEGAGTWWVLSTVIGPFIWWAMGFPSGLLIMPPEAWPLLFKPKPKKEDNA